MLALTPRPELHALFETLGYACGFAVYRRARRTNGDFLAQRDRWTVIAAAVVGALFGSRLLGLVEQMPRTHVTLSHLWFPGGGKTIVGGLLGGWLAVELVKKLSGIRTRTGDIFAIPLCVGIAVGRVGCLLAGLADDTYGRATNLPWAVDFGDGIGRHPTQAYEIVFLAALAFALGRMAGPKLRRGTLFRVFMASYLLWRLAVDFLKPQPLVAGMDVIQWACVAGLIWLAIGEWMLLSKGEVELGESYV